MGRTHRIVILVAAGLLAAAIAMLSAYPGGVRRTGHRARTVDGVSIAYDLYRPAPGATPPPVAIIGHGVVVNKEMMAALSLELAADGCVVAALDWRGHGASGGRLGSRDGLAHDLAAVAADLPRHMPNADMRRLALVGFSMGGPPTFRYAAGSDATRAWVGLGTVAPAGAGGPQNPPNALLLIGTLDEAFRPERVRATMDRLLTDGPAVYNRRYGSIADGTAREVRLLPGVDHLLIPYHGGVLRRTRNWVLESFGMPTGGSFALGPRLGWLALGLLGLAVLMYAGSALPLSLTTPTAADAPSQSIPARTVVSRTATSLLGWPLALLFLPLALTGLAFSALATAILGSCAVSLALALRRPARTAGLPLARLFREALGGGWQVWLRAAALAAALGVGCLLLVGRHWIGLLPGPERWLFLPLFFAPLFAITLWFAIFIQKLAGPALAAWLGRRSGRTHPAAGTWLATGLLFAWFAVLILGSGLLLDNFFFAMDLFPLAPMLASLALVGAASERSTGSALPAAFTSACLWTLAIVALSPAVDISVIF